ncbi:cGMP-dependent 3',5'-cyclic phosphodiesterase, partial [Schistosoma japonicum]
VLHQETLRISRLVNDRNMYEAVADSLMKLLNYDYISMYHFDKNEHEWIEDLKHYPIEKQVMTKMRWSQSPWMFDSLFKELKINNAMKILTTDSVDSIIQYINQLDLNVYMIDIFLDDGNPSMIVELHKTNQFSKYDKYLLTNYITSFLSIVMPHVYLTSELYVMWNKNELNTELVAYHMKITDNEVNQLVDHTIKNLTDLHPNFNEITFLTRNVNEQDSIIAIMIMFNQLGFIKHWNIQRSTLACFILTVKKNYRTPTYHDWTHAFTVGHMAYVALNIESTLMNQYLDKIEQLTLFVGALCHDIDHRGFNNNYQTLIQSPLAAIYGYKGSILEHHHVDQTM